MPRPKNSDFANSAIHGPHAQLAPRLRAKRRAWLAGNREREAQYEGLVTELDRTMMAPTTNARPVTTKAENHNEALDLSARLQHQLEYGPRLAPHVPPKRVR